MAKYITVGSVLTSKDDPKSFYIKMGQDVSLKKGETLSLRTKAQEMESLESAILAGKLSGDIAEKARERVSKIPDFVKFNIQVRGD